jgi:alkylated DNA repair protein alkB family protein 1
MPSFVGNISKIFAQTCMLLETTEASRNQLQFAPEACIVNYYNVKSLMGGHRDDLELALDKPVVSLSMGLSAIFLLGGKSKDEEPVIPILVRKGDIMCLGGDARLNFHSMARLLPHTVSLPTIDQTLCPSKEEQLSRASVASLFPQQQHEDDLDISSDNRLALEEYLSHHRININVRQVYPDEGSMI